MALFVTIRPTLRVNLDQICWIDYQPSRDETLVHFVGKKEPLALKGAEAEGFRNFVEGIGHKLVISGQAEEPGTADLTAALRGERDFSGLTGQ